MLKPKALPILAGAALGALVVASSPASANAIDGIDPNVFICNGCTSAPSAPTSINPGDFTIGVAGNASLVTPLVVLVAEAGSPSSAPSISLPTGVSPATSSNYFGLNTATTGTTTGELEFNGAIGNGSGQDTYSLAGLAAGNGTSQNLTNYQTFNPSVTTYSVYAFAVNEAFNSGGANNFTQSGFDLTNLDLSGGVAFVMAYGCEVTETAGTQCTPNGNVGSTPFTTVGVVPAPIIGHGLFVLLAVGGVLFGSKLLENLKKRHLQAA